MDHNNNKTMSRREFIRSSSAAAMALSVLPQVKCGKLGVSRSMTRPMGTLQFEATTLGLGGQASLENTPSDVDPTAIILKAFEMGINYFDTSNGYGPSQLNFGKAFRRLSLIPATAGYDEKLRHSIFLTSKTHVRWAKGVEFAEDRGIYNWTDGPEGSTAIDDLKRTLSQIFGDGEGNYPPGAYVDMMLVHNLNTKNEVDAAYEGYESTDASAERIGVLAALRDYRDGSNLTKLNPKEEKLLRHIGFSGHYSPPVMIEMIQRDSQNLLDAMLVSVNANERRYFNMQYNAIPLAKEKNMGIIGMKVFADGAMYHKEARWSRGPEDVVRTVGSASLPSRQLIEYALTTDGVHNVIIGIGHIDDDPNHCQLRQNLSAAQIAPGALSEADRRSIEIKAATAKGGNTNYFQIPSEALSPPRGITLNLESRGDNRLAVLNWHTAYAGDEPIEKYVINRDGQERGSVSHSPQISKEPFFFEDRVEDNNAHSYSVISVDRRGRRAESESRHIRSL